MSKTFNCGIGLALVVGKEHKEDVIKTLTEAGETVVEIGSAAQHLEGRCKLQNGNTVKIEL